MAEAAAKASAKRFETEKKIARQSLILGPIPRQQQYTHKVDKRPVKIVKHAPMLVPRNTKLSVDVHYSKPK